MLRRWRKLTSSRRRARLNPKQQPMTPCSSPVRDVSGQEEDRPDPPATTEHQQQQQQKQTQERSEEHGEPQRTDRPAGQLPMHGQVANTAAGIKGLSLDIDAFTRGGEVVEAVSDEEEHKGADQEPPVSYFDDSEGGSQTSSEESWASFPSSGSNSTDSSSDAEDDEAAPGPAADVSLPSQEAAFKFHEEFDRGGGDDVDDTDGPVSSLAEEFAMQYGGGDPPYPVDTGPWMSRAIPRWAFLRSSNSLPVLGLGPEDFYHGGSTLRHEVSPEEVEDEHEAGLDEDGEGRRNSREVATVGVVYL